ncbi:hypothetical protein HU200_032301 [Digitaria exilis]|uniref:Uncharacterized protein n=1 Tax=Digitaria exilis TaxID=1010633 RepID=A0A835BP17_9POAL|nr:hypothetical protein HU200_032301 [Digitaria exilis]
MAILRTQSNGTCGACELGPGQSAHLPSLRPSAAPGYNLSAGEKDVSGAACLVAWDKVQQTRDQGSSWALWVRANANISTLEGDLEGHHWTTLRESLTIYCAITSVRIGNGETTSFWFDFWYGDECLGDKFLAQVVSQGLDSVLVPRLTAIAIVEKDQVDNLHAPTPANNCRGSKTLSFCNNGWKAAHRAPFFAWLLVQERVQARAILVKRTSLTQRPARYATMPRKQRHISSLSAHSPSLSGWFDDNGVGHTASTKPWPCMALRYVCAPLLLAAVEEEKRSYLQR